MPKNYKKVVPVRYTARDFDSIKKELVEYAKRYYPTTFKDFNEASFGALMIDTVAYIGDMLSFYMDYQANESFMDTSLEYDNVVRHARRLGYKFRGNPTATGMGSFFLMIPATVSGAPDTAYMPTLKRGSTFSAMNGNQYILNEDIDVAHENNEIVVSRVDETTGLPTWFAVKTHGQLISGQMAQLVIPVGDFEKFRRIEIEADDVAEVIEVVDTEGHSYYEVDYLSQNVVYKPAKNPNYSGADGAVQHLLKPFMVPRRFVVEHENDRTFLQFGYGSDSELTTSSIADPSTVVLNQWGRSHTTDESFDPAKLLETDKFGVTPSNTTLTVIYRINSTGNVNAATDTVREVVHPILHFNNVAQLNRNTISFVFKNVEVTNEEPIIGDLPLPTSTEIKRRAKDIFATQNRAVTKQDYISVVYSMPPKYGAIKRFNMLRDHNSLKRNLNLYVMSENQGGLLTKTNESIKQNLKVWLLKNKMINDTIDILNARILNLGIEFSVIGDTEMNRYEILTRATSKLKSYYSRIPDIAEPFYISDVYTLLNGVDGVVDVINVEVKQLSGGSYSDLGFDVDGHTSSDGRFIKVPEDMIWEVKFPAIDIKGVVK
jgi:hypothetical protein